MYPALSWHSRLALVAPWGKHESFTHSSNYPSCLGHDLYSIQLLRKCSCVSAAGGLRGPFNKPDLIFTVVDGHQPKSFRVATVPDFSQTNGALSTLPTWQSCPAHIKVRSDLAYQMRFGLTSSGHQTAGSPPSSHQTQNLQRTKMLEKSTSTLPRILVWTSWPGQGAVSSREDISKASNYLMCGRAQWTGQLANSILYQTNQTFDRTCPPVRGLHTNELLMQRSDRRFSYSLPTDLYNVI